MLYAAAVERDIRLAGSYLVGDRWRDIAAGQQAGCTTILVTPDHLEPITATLDSIANDLPQTAALILSRQ